MKYNIVLASNSPRRKELLKRFINNFTIKSANVDETIDRNLSIHDALLQIARRKAEAVKNECDNNDIIIGADTVVVFNNKIYGKPKNKEDAFNTLKILSGNTHLVITSVCCIDKQYKIHIEFTEESKVKFININDNLINKYLLLDEYKDKAGSYAAQGIGSVFIEKIDGCYDNIVGLPVGNLIRKLINNNIYLI